ncbi:MAG: glycosyltransferase [Lacipirellulaceae bacterium]
MLVWLLDDGEPPPAEGPPRSDRFGSVGRRLAARGHRVVHWRRLAGNALASSEATETVIAPNQSFRSLGVGDASTPIVALGRRLRRRLATAFERQATTAERPDLVVAALPSPELAGAASRYAAASHVPLVIDVRSRWPDALAWNAPATLRRFAGLGMRGVEGMGRSALHGATAVMAPSATLLDNALRHAGRERRDTDRVYPYAYDDRPHHDGADADADGFWEKLRVGAGAAFRLAFVGRLGPATRLEPFIDAVRFLERRCPGEFELVVCGDGPRQPSLTRRAASSPSVRIVGRVAERRAAALLRRSTVGLAPYAAGAPTSLPRKAIECFAHSLPVLSTLGGSDLETLLAENDCGLTLEAPRTEHVVELLRVWRAQPQRMATLATNARRLYRTQFHAEAVSTAMAEHLERVGRASSPSLRSLRKAG